MGRGWSYKLIFVFILIPSSHSHEGITIETEDINLLESDNESVWGPLKECPAGNVVTGFKFIYLNNNDGQIPLPDQFLPAGITGVAFQCSKFNFWNNFVASKVIFDGIVSARQPWTYVTNSHATGFAFEKWTVFGSGVNKVGKWKFRFSGEKLPVTFPPGSIERVREEIECPESYAICGFRVLRSQRLDRIERFEFTCCYYCVPQEIQVVIYDFTNNGITDVQHTVTKKIGMSGGQNMIEGLTIDKVKKVDPGIEGETGQSTMLSSGQGAGGGGRSRKLKIYFDPPPPKIPPQNSSAPIGPPSERTPRTLQSSFKSKGKPRKLNRGAFTSSLDTSFAKPQGPPFSGAWDNFQKGLHSVLGRQAVPAPPAGGGGSAPATGGGSSSGGNGASGPSSSGAGTPSAASPSGGGSGSSNFNLKARFEAKFSGSISKSFSWKTVSWSQWTYSTEETDTLVCKALHRCVLKQLTGVCGIYQFHTPQFDFTHIPIRLDYFDDSLNPGGAGSASSGGSGGDLKSSDSSSNSHTVQKSGIWIQVKNLILSKKAKFLDKIRSCPPGSVVTGQQTKIKGGAMLTGLNLQCSKLNASSQFEPVTTMAAGTGSGYKWYNSTREAVGVTFMEFRVNGSSWRPNFELKFEGEDAVRDVPPGAQMIIRSEATCPPKYAICAMQAMFTTTGGGEMAALSMRCCHHCDPQEKIVVLESFTNLGYTDTIQTVTRIVGNVMNRELSHAANNLTENENRMDGINPAGLQAGFAAKFDKKIDSGFNWASTSTSFWTTHEEKTLTVLCKARMLCVYRQLVGVCNDIEIPTAYTIKESFPLDATSNDSLEGSGQGLLRIKRSGENWMVAENLTFAQRNEIWDPPLMCPSGTFVTGQQLKKNFGFGGLSIRCSRLNEKDEFVPVMELTSGAGNETKWYDANSPAIGFTFIEYQLNGTMWKAKWEVRFQNDTDFHSVPIGATNVTRSFVQCPPGHAISGMQTMFDMENKGQLTNIGFKCSFYCRPREKMIILNAFTNDGDRDTSQTIKFTIGAQKTSPIKSLAPNPFLPNITEGNVSRGVNTMDLQQIFAARYPKSRFPGFSWAETTRSLWTDVVEKSIKLPCKAGYLCTFKQLIGFCADFEILSPYTLQRTSLLNGTLTRRQKQPPRQHQTAAIMSNEIFNAKSQMENRKPQRRDIQMNRNGEIWMMAANLTSSKKSGVWESPQLCLPGTVVTAYVLEQTPNGRFGGLSMRCSKIWKSGTKFETALVLKSRKREIFESPTTPKWIPGKSYAVGFSYNDYEINGSVWRAHWRLNFNGDDETKEEDCEIENGAQNIGRTDITCPHPKNYAICGQQSMFDKERKGVVTQVSFKCCYYCAPQQKILTLDSFQNLGSTESLQTVKLMIGLSEKGQSFILENFVNPADIQQYFSTWFEKLNTTQKINNFDWSETSLTLFTSEEVKMTNYICPARHFCSFRQLMGICGQVEIRTPFTIKESIPLDPPPISTQEPPLILETRKPVSSTVRNRNRKLKPKQKKKLEIKKKGEIWILAGDLTSFEKSGVWSTPQLCPPGSFVTSEKFKTNPQGLSGLHFQCSIMDEKGQLVRVAKLNSGAGSDSQWYEGNAPANGFTFVEYEVNGSTHRAHWEVTHRGKEVIQLGVPEEAQNVVQNEVTCPLDHVICGVQTMFDKGQKGVLTNVGLKCCYFCSPEERVVTLDLMTNLGNLDTNQKVNWMVGTKVMGSKDWPNEEKDPKISLTPSALRAVFASRFGVSSWDSQWFNWRDTPNSLFAGVEVKNSEYLCPARHFCTFKQLTGFCGGEIEISTPYYIQQTFSLDMKDPLGGGSSDAKIVNSTQNSLNMTVI